MDWIVHLVSLKFNGMQQTIGLPLSLRSSAMRTCLLLLALLLGACQVSPPQSPASVLLISLDGVRPDYLGRGDTPNLDRLAREGVQAQWMQSVYPSLTFPNHYSMVTGLYPDHHGIVHNTMHDAELGRFTLGDREAVSDGRWWDGEPIWVTAERAGLATATLSWPGSEAEIQGVRPTRWHLFDAQRPIPERVEIVLGWLSEPDITRPRLATLYFEHPDSAGHHYGPHSPEVRATMREVDAAIGTLLEGLEGRGLLDKLNIVIVSDHGMAEVPATHTIATEDMVPVDKADIVSVGQVIGVQPHPGQEEAVAAVMVGTHAQYECWRKAELPARWHYGQHPRVPAIICQMHEGWDALSRRLAQERQASGQTRGAHGFDPTLESMRAIFIARGPAFKQGATVPAFENINIQPLVLHLLGLPPMQTDGELTPLLPALANTKN